MTIVTKDKLTFLLRSAVHYFQKGVCPYCQTGQYKIIQKKYLVTSLVQCDQCHLLYRLPNDPTQFNDEFYQSSYVEYDGITTYLPTGEKLQEMLDNKFNKTTKGIEHILPLFKALIPETENINLIDYGASWGYMSYLFREQGINVQSYEISKPRALYGNEKLGLDIKIKLEDLKTNNNIFFSSHVIEHVPSIKNMIDDAKKLISGIQPAFFIALSPNGSFDRMKHEPNNYKRNWGLVHPNFISDLFYKKIFAEYPYFMDSNPYDYKALDMWDQKSQYAGDMKGDELMIIVKLKN